MQKVIKLEAANITFAAFFYTLLWDMKNKQDYWSDYWLNDGQEGEVFVNSKGEKPEYIRTFWREKLVESIDSQTSIVDLACGAGSIFEDLDDVTREKATLIATDISQAALDIAKQRVPEATTICCGCEDLPFDDNSLEKPLLRSLREAD